MENYSFPERHQRQIQILKITFNAIQVLFTIYLLYKFFKDKQSFHQNHAQRIPKLTTTFIFSVIVSGIYSNFLNQNFLGDKLFQLFSLIILTVLILISYYFRNEKKNFYFEFSKKKRLIQLLLVTLLMIGGNLFNPIIGFEFLKGLKSTFMMIFLIVDTLFFCEFKFSHGFFLMIFLPNYIIFSPVMQKINSSLKIGILIFVSSIGFLGLFILIVTKPLKFFGEYEFLKSVKKSQFYRGYEEQTL